jgi:hypothetical protein
MSFDNATLKPDWAVAPTITEAEFVELAEDPFAAASGATADFAELQEATLDNFEASVRTATQSAHGTPMAADPVANSTLAAPAAAVAAEIPRLADSADYIARLEKRLAKIHTRPQEKASTRALAGAEFFVTSSTSTSSAAAHAAASRHNALSNPNASWLGEEDEDAAEAEAKSAAYLGESMEHSSEDEDETAERPPFISSTVEPSIEEQLALLDQHEQQMPEEIRAELESAHIGVGAAMGATAPVALPVSTVSSAAAPASSSSTVMQPMAGPTKQAIEISDGDETAAPTHNHTTPAPTSILPHRLFFYSTQTCLAQVTNWWEEENRCVIS